MRVEANVDTFRRTARLFAMCALLAACTSAPSDGETTTTAPAAVTIPPATTTTTSIAESEGLVSAPVRHPATSRLTYFVMTDRFENGTPDNDTGRVDPAAGPLRHGHLPEDIGFHHGGDLRGLTQRLDYIAGLGVEAIWITPPFVNRTVQGDGTPEGSSSGYHGYWNVDWTRIDPHLGDSADMIAFIEAASERGIAVYFDIVVNHTGDVITYGEEVFSYRGMGSAPYLTADGREFDPALVAGTAAFPDLDAEISFPYTPTFADEADATIKAPDWLNDVTVYHNRGNSTFQGESSLYGDFFGLDDLFTEDPRVVDGMIELYADVIETYPVAGFRVDTVKHVNDEFWAEFLPAIRRAAADAGREDFFVFGEVFSEDPIFNSGFSTVLDFSSTLDFLFDSAVRRFVTSDADASFLAQIFDDDDWYTDADSNASMNVKFLGNHDLGRLGYFVDIASPGASDQRRLDRISLALDLMFTTRGVPLVYYGDEQGFTGVGGDQAARQTMFASTAPEYLDDDLIGTERTHAESQFDTGHPLYQRISALSETRESHPALVTGAQLTRAADGAVFAFSRIDRDQRLEYLVAANGGDGAADSVEIPSSTPGAVFTQIHPVAGAIEVAAGVDGIVTMDLPPTSLVVLVADRPVPVPTMPATIAFDRPSASTEIPTFRYRIEASLGDQRFAEVTFSARIDGGEPVLLGTDDAPPYRVYWDNSPYPDGAEVEFFAVVSDGSGRLVETSVNATLGTR